MAPSGAPLAERPPYPLEAVSSGHGGAAIHEFVVNAGSEADGATLIELGLPEGSLIVLISRGDEFVVPQGSTALLRGDKVLVLADADAVDLIRQQVEIAHDQ